MMPGIVNLPGISLFGNTHLTIYISTTTESSAVNFLMASVLTMKVHLNLYRLYTCQRY